MRIRCATTSDGHIEAAYGDSFGVLYAVVVNRRTGEVIATTVHEDSDDFRRLVRAAREHCAN